MEDIVSPKISERGTVKSGFVRRTNTVDEPDLDLGDDGEPRTPEVDRGDSPFSDAFRAASGTPSAGRRLTPIGSKEDLEPQPPPVYRQLQYEEDSRKPHPGLTYTPVKLQHSVGVVPPRTRRRPAGVPARQHPGNYWSSSSASTRVPSTATPATPRSESRTLKPRFRHQFRRIDGRPVSVAAILDLGEPGDSKGGASKEVEDRPKQRPHSVEAVVSVGGRPVLARGPEHPPPLSLPQPVQPYRAAPSASPDASLPGVRLYSTPPLSSFAGSPLPSAGRAPTQLSTAIGVPGRRAQTADGTMPPASAREVPSAEAMARLATPRDRERGLSERQQRRTLALEYTAYAQEAAATLLPGVPPAERGLGCGFAFGDVWHTAGEDGYRSAVCHAAVRCREALQNAGLGSEVEGAVFKGQARNDSEGGALPDIVRLHTTCLLLEELAKVSSPLQDTLRFVLRELCHCIFADFQAGSDVLHLTPYWVLAVQAQKDAAEERERAEEATAECRRLRQRVADLEAETENLKETVQTEHATARQAVEERRLLQEERNALLAKVAQLTESGSIWTDEVRELSAESASLQGALYISGLELDQSRKEGNRLAVLVKEQERRVEVLERRIHDLLRALHIAHGEEPALEQAAGPASSPLPQLPAGLQVDLSARRAGKRGSLKSKEKQAMKGPGGRPLLKVPTADGNWQLVMRSTAGEEKGLEQLWGKNSRAGPQLVLVSGDVFAALSIALALPRPPDVSHFGAQEDEAIVKEVHDEVLALVQEHRALLEVFQGQRQDLKEALRLVPQWNVDELRGLLRSVVMFDAEETRLAPSPVSGSTTLVGLGAGAEVPPFLRYEGLLTFRPIPEPVLFGHLHDLWLAKTVAYLQSILGSLPIAPLGEFFSEVYLPRTSPDPAAQKELSYNFLLGLRKYTTLYDPFSPDAEHTLSVTIVAARGLRDTDVGQDPNDRSDPYCVCQILGKPQSKIQTKVVNDCLDPVWQQSGELPCFFMGDSLTFTIYDKDNGTKDEVLGKATLPSAQFFPYGIETELPLSHAGRGIRAFLTVRVAPVKLPAGFAAEGNAAQQPAEQPPATATGAGGTPAALGRGRAEQAILARPPSAGRSQARPQSAGRSGQGTKVAQASGSPGNASPGPRNIEMPGQVSFLAGGEVLYRSLLGELHEDYFHDQTTMLVVLAHAIASLSERLARPVPKSKSLKEGSQWERLAKSNSKALGQGQLLPASRSADETVLGLAELSALLRLFFPSKPREHLSALKKILHSASTPEDMDGERAGSQPDDEGEVRPRVVNVSSILSILPNFDQDPDGEKLITDLIQNPTPLTLELRRQHLIECWMFLERVQAALLMMFSKNGRDKEVAAGLPVPVTVKDADAALSAADRSLTDDQRCLYLLRGFGRRLPDMPSTYGVGSTTQEFEVAGEAVAGLYGRSASDVFGNKRYLRRRGDAASKAARVQKLRLLLKDRVSQLAEEGALVNFRDFLSRLRSTGVFKGARTWQPDITVAEVVQEAGLLAVRGTAASAVLEEFLGADAAAAAAAAKAAGAPAPPPRSPTATAGLGRMGTGGQLAEGSSEGRAPVARRTNSKSRSLERQLTVASSNASNANLEAGGVLDWFRFHVETGRDVWELSVGYPGLALSYWVSA